MGHPKRSRKKYERPKKLWDKARLAEEKALKKEYGLKNMRELWIAKTILKKYRRWARSLLALPEEERKKGEKELIAKLVRMGVFKGNETLDDVLSLPVNAILERRLQTLVYRKGLAKTMKQARQLIVHGFIQVDGVRVRMPSFLVDKEREDKIGYYKPFDFEKANPVYKSEGEENG